MMNWSALGAGSRALIGVGVAGVIGVSGYFIKQSGMDPAPEVTETAAVTVAAAPKKAIEAQAEPTTQVVLPSFDLVRIDPLGNTTVAGSAEPAQALSFRIDGVEIAQSQTDGQGQFASLFTIAPSPNPRLLTLVAIGSDGHEIMAANSVAISPFAEAAPEVAASPAEVAADAPVEPAPDATPVAADAAQAPVALVISAAGVEAIVNETVAPTDATPAENPAVTIAAITYSANGGVVLSGVGAALAPLRLYLNQAAVAEGAVSADGNWSVELADVAPGLYTLRIDQLNAEGQVDARFETPFKRETQETLAAASVVEAPVAQVSNEVVAEGAVVAEPVVAEPAATVADTSVIKAAPAAEPSSTAAEASKPEVAAVAAETIVIVGEAAAPEVKVETAAVVPAAPVTITVQPGFTLWRIAQDQLGEGIMYIQVFNANKGNIADPDLIYPGQIFTIPKQAD